MGSCLSSSKIDTRTAGQGQRLGGAPSSLANKNTASQPSSQTRTAPAQAAAPTPARKARDASGNDDREQRAKAAEERAKALASRGAGSAISGGGKLSRQLEEQNRRTNAVSDGREDKIPERVIWD